jgi:hypothetical protein
MRVLLLRFAPGLDHVFLASEKPAKLKDDQAAAAEIEERGESSRFQPGTQEFECVRGDRRARYLSGVSVPKEAFRSP